MASETDRKFTSADCIEIPSRGISRWCIDIKNHKENFRGAVQPPRDDHEFAILSVAKRRNDLCARKPTYCYYRYLFAGKLGRWLKCAIFGLVFGVAVELSTAY